MATQSRAKKATTKAAKGGAKKRSLKLTPTAAAFTIDRRKAQKCLAETGKITLGFKEIGTTRLSELTDAIVTVN